MELDLWLHPPLFALPRRKNRFWYAPATTPPNALCLSLAEKIVWVHTGSDCGEIVHNFSTLLWTSHSSTKLLITVNNIVDLFSPQKLFRYVHKNCGVFLQKCGRFAHNKCVQNINNNCGFTSFSCRWKYGLQVRNYGFIVEVAYNLYYWLSMDWGICCESRWRPAAYRQTPERWVLLFPLYGLLVFGSVTLQTHGTQTW